MIPRTIHCCWFGGKALPNDVKKFLEGWKKFNPDYQIKVWNEKNFDYKSNRYAREAYENGKWAFVTDYVRLKVLYDFGGIYMDTDVEVIKPLDVLLKNKAFSGFEAPDRINTGTMGSEKHNPWIKLLLQYYEDRVFILPNGKFDLTTNVKTITEITKEHYAIQFNNTYQELEHITLYPFDVLCAKNLHDGKIKSSENTITIHHFKGSWTSPKAKLIKFLNTYFGNDFVRMLVKIKKFLRL